MAETTKIEWTNRRDPTSGAVVEGKTFNPWIGCTKVSEACKNCYAERDAKRRGMVAWGPEASGGTRVLTGDNYWTEAERWARKAHAAGVRPLVFCASWADVAEEWAGPMIDSHGRLVMRHPELDGRAQWKAVPFLSSPDELAPPGLFSSVCTHHAPGGWLPLTMRDAREELWRLIARTSHALDWLLLTKRPDVLARAWPGFEAAYRAELERQLADPRPVSTARPTPKDVFRRPLAFVDAHGLIPSAWPGATVEAQKWVAPRLAHLCSIPAVRRFVSAEPLVERVVFAGTTEEKGLTKVWNYLARPPVFNGTTLLDGDRHGVHWLITGGESGGGASPAHPAWYRDLRTQAAGAGTPFFFKQWGEFLPLDHAAPGDEASADEWVWPDGVARDVKDPAVTAATRAGRIPLPMTTFRVGKKAAGRTLDGVEHSAIPESVL